MSVFKIDYNINEDIAAQELNQTKLNYELNAVFSSFYSTIMRNGENFSLYFKRNLTNQEAQDVEQYILSHIAQGKFGPKILDMVSDELRNKPYQDIDYKSELKESLYPKRSFFQGELREVKWFRNPELTDLVLKVNINYERDQFGFATRRDTIRTWYNFENEPLPTLKTTEKIYTINPIDQILEGKRRRGNIVDGVQLPVLSFLLEAASDEDASAEYSLNPQTVLLLGRDFMDRFNSAFKNFVDNSSTITDINDPNFGKKTINVAFEQAAISTDTWLNFKPNAMGGQLSILNYLVGEFSI